MMFWPMLHLYVLAFFPLFVRVYVFLRFAPLFSSPGVLGIVRVAMALSMAFLLLPVLEQRGQLLFHENSLLFFAFHLVLEALLGLIQAYILQVFQALLVMALQFFSFPMGLGFGAFFNPFSGEEDSLVAPFFTLLSYSIFIWFEGMTSLFFWGVYQSLRFVSATDLIILSQRDSVWPLVEHMALLFERSFVLALPIVGTLFLMHVFLGFLSKAASQLNLLILSFPIALSLGFFLLWFSFPSLIKTAGVFTEESFRALEFYLSLLRRGVSP